MALFSTYNYLVPAAGKTSAYMLSNFTGSGSLVDFSKVSSDTGAQFNPSGVVIDNVNGTAIVTIVIQPINFTITCPIGKQMGISFPAPDGATAVVSATGATIGFVDYPVIPYQY